MCAQSLLRSHSALGAFCRRICSRLGKPKGIIAAAHKLALLIYRMLKYGREYTDIGQDRYENRTKRGWGIFNRNSGEISSGIDTQVIFPENATQEWENVDQYRFWVSSPPPGESNAT